MLAELRRGPMRSRAQQNEISIIIDGTAIAVRTGLQRLLADNLLTTLSYDSRGKTEIVLAEALNNVVEHAYPIYVGQIEVTVQRLGADLEFTITDSGLPLPDGELPKGILQNLDDLPEGGFGWFLIRRMSHSLTYLRSNDRNRLHFCMDVDYSD